MGNDMDDLALSVHGIPTPASSRKDIDSLAISGAQSYSGSVPGYPGSGSQAFSGASCGYPGSATPVYPAYPGPHGYNSGASQGQYPVNAHGQVPEQINKMYTTPYGMDAPNTQYVETEHVETEIM